MLKLGKALAFDLASDLAATSRFVIVDEYEIRGGGIVREALPDRQGWVRDKVLLRNSSGSAAHRSPSGAPREYNQKATLLLITGDQETDRKALAKEFEARLFEGGRWSTSSASAACSTASTPTSSASPRTGWSTSAGWARSPTSCSMPA